MGASESKISELKHELLFSEEEREKVAQVFCNISHGKKTFNKENFQHFTNPVLDVFTSRRLFDLLEGPLPHHHQHKGHHKHAHQHHTHQAHEIHLQHFASHLTVLLKGDVHELARICIFLAAISPKTVPAKDFVKFVYSILHSYEKLLTAHCTAYQSWIFASTSDSHERLAHHLLYDLLYSSEVKVNGASLPEIDPRLTFTEEDVTNWLSCCSFFTQVLNQVFHGAFQFFHTEPQQITFTPRVPQVRDTNWSKFQTMLDFPTVLFLNFALFTELQTQWKLIFSNSVHGCSFSQLLQHIRNKGPTYLIVRDKDGHVFGGFASISWDITSKFIGNASCFLFSVKPKFCTYKPTGYNEHFMYLNHQVQTLPNGLGMGGQFEYFGLWIDQSFDYGHSKASAKGCTTFGSPQLSASPEFQVDSIEVWAVGRGERKEGDEDEEEEDEEDGAGKGAKGGKQSILDKLAAEDRALLDMVDRGTISDALREEPLIEETKAHSTIISPF